MIDDLTIAIHEAAHVVVAYRFNHDIGPVTIRPDDEARGRARTEGQWRDSLIEEQLVLVAYAGGAATAAFCGTDEGTWCDEEDADRLLGDLPAGAESRLRAEADRLVRENEHAIRALATALLEEGELDGAEAIIIIDAADGSIVAEDLLERVELDDTEAIRFIDAQEAGEDWRWALHLLRMNRRAAARED
jgi:hypothetical protein